MINPEPIKRCLRSIFFFSPEKTDKSKRILVLILMGLVAFLLIHFIGTKTDDTKSKETIFEIAIGLIPEFIGSIAVYWVLDSTIKQLYGITELPDLPLENFVNDIRSVKRIRILETFTKLATSPTLYKKFSKVVEETLRNGADIQILLIHPESEGAKQRAEELGKINIDVLQQIQLTLARLYKLEKKVLLYASNSRGKLEIRLYKASPSIAMHMWDRDAYVSFFPVGQRSDEAPNLKISMATTFGSYATSKFEELWNHNETITLVSYMELKVILPDNSNREEMLYCVRKNSNATSSFYVSNHFSNTLQEHLERECQSQNHNVKIIAEGHNHLAMCSKLTSGDRIRSKIVSQFQEKYDWSNEDTENTIRLDATIYQLELTSEKKF